MSHSGAQAAGVAVEQPSARSLILDIYGAHVRALGGWLAVAALVALLGDLGHDEQAVRAAVSRMKRSALLDAQTRDGAAGYALTVPALEILHDGDERLFQASTPPDLSKGWIVAIFSVPERSRAHRHHLRAHLARLGFGPVAPGAWIAPSRTRAEAQRLLDRTQLSQYVTLFEGDYQGCSDIRSVVARAWDLRSIDLGYRQFIDVHQRTRRSWLAPGRGNGDAFIHHMRVLAAWRHLAYLDPGLPGELLPPRWSGDRARALFAELHEALATPASMHVATLVTEARVAA